MSYGNYIKKMYSISAKANNLKTTNSIIIQKRDRNNIRFCIFLFTNVDYISQNDNH